jgi:hypothetical protein
MPATKKQTEKTPSVLPKGLRRIMDSMLINVLGYGCFAAFILTTLIPFWIRLAVLAYVKARQEIEKHEGDSSDGSAS